MKIAVQQPVAGQSATLGALPEIPGYTDPIARVSRCARRALSQHLSEFYNWFCQSVFSAQSLAKPVAHTCGAQPVNSALVDNGVTVCPRLNRRDRPESAS